MRFRKRLLLVNKVGSCISESFMKFTPLHLPLVLAVSMLPLSPAAALTIVINPDAGLAANTAALQAFNRAADQWEAAFSDGITVTVDASLQSLAANVIGATDSMMLYGEWFEEVLTPLRAEAGLRVAAGEIADAATAQLPSTYAMWQAQTRLPNGRSLADSIQITKANLKAIVADDGGSSGYTASQLDTLFGAADAAIIFSSNFAFDYDRADGITAGTMDFQTVASHEIGHALGFLSAVDDLDQTSALQMPLVSPTPLDLFRFRAADVPGSPSVFTAATRSLIPGEAASWSDGVSSWSLSTGKLLGDGQQASHWKDDVQTGFFVGLLDPTLPLGVIEDPTEADFAALGRIGWNYIPIPEPGAMALAGMAALGVLTRRRR